MSKSRSAGQEQGAKWLSGRQKSAPETTVSFVLKRIFKHSLREDFKQHFRLVS
jgi:hypothetical protein